MEGQILKNEFDTILQKNTVVVCVEGGDIGQIHRIELPTYAVYGYPRGSSAGDMIIVPDTLLFLELVFLQAFRLFQCHRKTTARLTTATYTLCVHRRSYVSFVTHLHTACVGLTRFFF